MSKEIEHDKPDAITRLRAENERLREALDEAQQAFALENYNAKRLRAALIPFACRCARKGEGAGGTCLAPGGVCSSWNARAALEEKQ